MRRSPTKENNANKKPRTSAAGWVQQLCDRTAAEATNHAGKKEKNAGMLYFNSHLHVFETFGFFALALPET